MASVLLPATMAGIAMPVFIGYLNDSLPTKAEKGQGRQDKIRALAISSVVSILIFSLMMGGAQQAASYRQNYVRQYY